MSAHAHKIKIIICIPTYSHIALVFHHNNICAGVVQAIYHELDQKNRFKLT